MLSSPSPLPYSVTGSSKGPMQGGKCYDMGVIGRKCLGFVSHIPRLPCPTNLALGSPLPPPLVQPGHGLQK